MQTALIKYLIEKLGVLRYLDKVYGLGAIVKRGDDSFPAYYSGNELQSIAFDGYKSLIYFLPNGKVSRKNNEHPQLACVEQVEENYPFTLILYAQGNEDVNCVSQSQNIAWAISSYLNGIQKQFQQATGLEVAVITTTNIETDRAAVWKSQFSGDSKLKDNDILISIEIDFTITGVLSCFIQQPCDFVTFTYEASYTTFCSKVDACLGDTMGRLRTINFQTINGFDYFFDGTVSSYNPLGLDLRGAIIDQFFIDGRLSSIPDGFYSWNSALAKLTLGGDIADVSSSINYHFE